MLCFAMRWAGACAFVLATAACGGQLDSQCDACMIDATVTFLDARQRDVSSTDGDREQEASPPCMADASLPSLGCYEVGDLSNFQPPAFVPPRPVTNDCAPSQVQGLWDACFSGMSTTTCFPWSKANANCMNCVFTPSTATAWGAIVDYPGYGSFNVAGCAALHGDLPCAKALEANNACLSASCGSSGWHCGAQEDKGEDFMQCVVYEELCGCKTYADGVDTACSKAPGSAFKLCELTTAKEDYFRYVPMFCSGGG